MGQNDCTFSHGFWVFSPPLTLMNNCQPMCYFLGIITFIWNGFLSSMLCQACNGNAVRCNSNQREIAIWTGSTLVWNWIVWMYNHNFSNYECRSSLLLIWSKLSISKYTARMNLGSWLAFKLPCQRSILNRCWHLRALWNDWDKSRRHQWAVLLSEIEHYSQSSFQFGKLVGIQASLSKKHAKTVLTYERSYEIIGTNPEDTNELYCLTKPSDI